MQRARSWSALLGATVLVGMAIVLASVPGAHAQTAPLGVDPAGALATETGSRSVDRARSLFPRTEHWFDIVATARFERLQGGRLRPDLAALEHPRVRHADGAGHSIVPTFARSWRGPLRIASGEDPRVWIEVTPASGRDVAARIEDGLIVYPGAYPDTDILYKSTPTHVDEYRVITAPAGVMRWVYRVRRGPGIARVRAAGAAIEAVDAQGVPWMRGNAPFAIDHRGVRADGTVRAERDTLVVEIDLGALEPPILVDPDWRSTGDMAFGRFYNGGNLLPDGRVLVTGGCTASVCSGDLSLPACRAVVVAAEALDLATRTWSRLGDAAVRRFFHVSESLPDRSILMVGGCTDPACAFPTETAELFDARTLSFRTLASVPEALAGTSSVTLADGTVLVAGGCTDARCSTRAHVFDPATDTFTEIAPMRRARGRAFATRLSDGRVLVAGGCTTILCASVLAEAELFDPLSGEWSEVAPMSVPRGGHYGARLADGRVLVGGGCADQACTTVHRSAELFDPVTLGWTATEDMARPRFGALAARLPDGKVMVNQGCAGDTDCDLTNELFDPAGARFAMIEPAVTVRAFHQLVVHPGANLAISMGGCQPRTCSWWNETYDLSSLHPLPDGGLPELPDGGPRDAGARRDAGIDAGRPSVGGGGEGCGCRVGASGSSGLTAGLASLLALALAVRRRRA